jgi:hypothetical protein
VVSPDQESWDGIDGAWNTFSLRVGSQQENVSVLVSTANQQIWVVNDQACTPNAMRNLPNAVWGMSQKDCGNIRGHLFNTSQSSTWYETGYFNLEVSPSGRTDRGAYGLFGLDTVGLVLLDQDDGPITDNMTVGTIGTQSTLATPQFWLGHIGLQTKPSEFYQQPSRPSYITALFEAQGIPSQAFGYTAGAQYRTGEATNLASLTLGGYDASRFISNDVVFAPDKDGNLPVGLVQLTAQTATNSNINLLKGTNVDLYINSTAAEIWLPVNICKIFEETFGLIYDEATGLYLVDNILHQILSNQNPNITFTLRKVASDIAAGTVNITLPYQAFDLQAKPPYRGLEEEKRYFPIRRGINSSQWMLGRTFLQEAYLKVDWERDQFSVYERDWTSKKSDVVAIVSPRYATKLEDPGSDSGPDPPSSRLSTAAIVGIVIGVAVAVLLAVVAAWWMWRRRNRKTNSDFSFVPAPTSSGSTSITRPDDSAFSTPGAGPLVFPKAELPGESTVRDPFADTNAVQQPIYEMMGDIPATEAGGRQLSEKESMIVRERNINGVDPLGASSSSISNTAARSTPVSSMDEIVTMDRRHHHTNSFSSATEQLPPYQAQHEDVSRRRFSYET